MQVIKRIFLILYVLILGFIVFCNTSIFGADGYILDRQIGATYTSFDEYFLDCQESFDYLLINNINKNNAYSWFYNWYYNNDDRKTNYHYFVLPTNIDVPSTSGQNRAYTIYVYAQKPLSQTRTFSYADFQNYYMTDIGGVPVEDRSLYFTAIDANAWWVIDIYNFGNSYRFSNSNGSSGGTTPFSLPITLLNYPHNIIQDYFISNTSGGQIASAINNQTNTLKEETQKQTNAVVSATQSQTNEILDTNNTGNDTMSVNDTTTDTSADLSGIYNSISSAFTDSSVQQPKSFEMTLPNGDTYTFGLSASILTNFLNKYPVLKAFYQAFFYVVFCGYVIFDFKRIINKLKEGDIDNVVGSSNPVDSVVNMSLK